MERGDSMKKFLKTALILAMVAACLTTVALAADSSVTYSGTSGEFIFAPGSSESPTDLFPDFKGVMPGDSLTQKIVVKNDADKKVDVKIYMRALGATEGEEFLNQMKLTVVQSGNVKLFEAPADETAQLTNWKPLGTFKSGSKVTLDVTLEVPIEMGNEFQDAVGELQWEFRVEEYPIEGPQTGDETPLALYGTVAAVCALGLVLLLATKRKKAKEN